MFNWRNTLIVGAFFVVVGIIYFVTQGAGTCAPEMTHCTSRTLDLTGVLMLILAGVSMAFGLAVLVRGSRDV
jgi:drug/metabolite transporter (DMT)-like permease